MGLTGRGRKRVSRESGNEKEGMRGREWGAMGGDAGWKRSNPSVELV